MISQVVDLITNHCDLNLTNLLKKILASLAGPVLAGCKKTNRKFRKHGQTEVFFCTGVNLDNSGHFPSDLVAFARAYGDLHGSALQPC